ncbi:hypothetical protein [Bradyrhizobium sp. RDT46]|uniref:hypothetical protein n=1 Tax=Bradyrhizobium sp. RDT46 TaxID=3341829 RepID=UPI0035C7487B
MRTLACAVAWICALLQATRNVELLTGKNFRLARDRRPQAKPSAASVSRMTDVRNQQPCRPRTTCVVIHYALELQKRFGWRVERV